MSSITHSITKSMFDCSGLITIVRNVHYISESAVGVVGLWWSKTYAVFQYDIGGAEWWKKLVNIFRTSSCIHLIHLECSERTWIISVWAGTTCHHSSNCFSQLDNIPAGLTGHLKLKLYLQSQKSSWQYFQSSCSVCACCTRIVLL